MLYVISFSFKVRPKKCHNKISSNQINFFFEPEKHLSGNFFVSGGISWYIVDILTVNITSSTKLEYENSYVQIFKTIFALLAILLRHLFYLGTNFERIRLDVCCFDCSQFRSNIDYDLLEFCLFYIRFLDPCFVLTIIIIVHYCATCVLYV